jgi:tetratricopeptide (TPR) repeat protein
LEECVVLRREVGDDEPLAEALHRLGAVALAQGEYARAGALLEEALALHRCSGQVGAGIGSLSLLAAVASEEGDEAHAEALLGEALARCGELEGWKVYLLLRLSRLAHQRSDSAAARTLYCESLERAQELDRHATETQAAPVASRLLNLAYVADELGAADEARALCRESLERFRAARLEEGAAFACLILGRWERARGELGAARVYLGEALASYERLAMLHAVAACLEQIAALAVVRNADEEGARLCGAAAALRAAIGTRALRSEREAHERTLAGLRVRLGDAVFRETFGAGEGLPRERALALAREVLGAASPARATRIRRSLA